MVRPVTEDDTGLRVLHEPLATDGSVDVKIELVLSSLYYYHTAKHVASIVAVHGIGAHPDDTWSKNVGTKEAPRYLNWLSDKTMLPAVVPAARIMRYGYESAWFGREATKQSSSHVARRLLLTLRRKRRDVPYKPLLFIAHCFGGLVVLKALLDAKEDEKEWLGIFASTTGLIFFGTPFRGAEGLSQSEMLDAARREYEPDQIQGDVLRVLEPGNEFLQDIVDKFGRTRSQPNKSLVACFFELKASNVGAIVGRQERTRFVVSESSGCLDLSEGTQKYSLSRNHFNMNKFGKPDEEDFETVREVVETMAAAADELVLARTQNSGKYATRFSLEGIPIVHKFVSRPAEMDGIERTLLSQDSAWRRKVYVLRGLGGIGKTQLAVEFARRSQTRFSSIFWLDGSSESSVKRSIATCARRIPEGQIAESSRSYAGGGSADIDAVVKDVLDWLAVPENKRWLLIFDNVDRDYHPGCSDVDAYDVERYFSGADHGSILITTRLDSIKQLGESQEVGRLSREQGESLLRTWYKGKIDSEDCGRLLRELDGLSLAIAQAGGYIQSRGISITKYLEYYTAQWAELMTPSRRDVASFKAYAGRSVMTTWAMSYEAIREQDEHAANLLLLWSMLDNKDLWHGMFAAACRSSQETADALFHAIGEIATDEFYFSNAMSLLSAYSLIESTEGTGGYATHAVVHKWAYHHQAKQVEADLGPLAIRVVGWAVPMRSSRDYSTLQRRLLSHAQACSRMAVRMAGRMAGAKEGNEPASRDVTSLLTAYHMLGLLYVDQGKLVEAEAMYVRALQGKEEALGAKHTLTLNTVNNLGILYADQGKLMEAKAMYVRALQGLEEALGAKHMLTLSTVNNLGLLYANQGKLMEAEAMFVRALQGREEALGAKHTSTLSTVSNLGNLYRNQGKLVEAEAMYVRALQGLEEALGAKHTSTLVTVGNLSELYTQQCFLSSLVPDNGLKYRKSDTSIAKSLVRQAAELHIRFAGARRSGLAKLGRMLLWATEGSTAAMMAFRYQYTICAPYHHAYCDGCAKQLSASTGRAVCKVCKEIDLCRDCCLKHLDGQVLTTLDQCSDHAFFDCGDVVLERPDQLLEDWLALLSLGCY